MGVRIVMAVFIVGILAFAGMCFFAVYNESKLSDEGEKTRNEECRMKNEGGAKRDGRGAVGAFERMLPPSFLERSGVPVQNIAGIRIKDLAVNRVENGREVPVFAADESQSLLKRKFRNRL